MRRSSSVWGVTLILLGVFFISGQFFPRVFDNDRLWPFSVIGVGAAFLVLAASSAVGPLAIPGCIMGGIGVMLYWQNATHNWESWAYAWTLIPGFIGIGFLVWGLINRRLRRLLRSNLVLVGVSLLAFFIFWTLFTNGQWTWPLIIVGMGAIFLLLAAACPLAGLAIPGSIVGGIGLLLWWQNTTSNWESWAYVWTLIPCFVGVGIIITAVLGANKRAGLRASLILLLIGVGTFAVFVTAFNYKSPMVGMLWPIVLLLLGLYFLTSTLFKKRT
jgi:peptidoglycan/LPS O-acetylase OafA/YrhL